MNFLKTFFAALLAILVANIFLGMFAVMFLAGVVLMLGQRGGQAALSENTILRIDLSSAITDSPVISPLGFDIPNIKYNRTISLYDAVTAIDYASIDSRIKGIYINVQGDNVSLANIEELRHAVDRFRSSGKFVVSYNNIYTQTGYYLSSVSDKVYINPKGVFEWQGMSSPVLFFKGLMDKLGVEAEIFRHGVFKSAVEPFIQHEMSPENRLQMNTLMKSTWTVILQDIGRSRDIGVEDMDRYAETLMIRSADDALTYGLVDDVLYQDEVYAVLSRLVGGGDYYADQDDTTSMTAVDIEDQIVDDEIGIVDLPAVVKHRVAALTSNERPKFISLTDYVKHNSVSSGTLPVHNASKNKIAIVYADGELIDGHSSGYMVGDISLNSKLARVRVDDNVKAVVLRVNSPGGSAVASEEIWRAVEVLRSVKPVVVSMGGTAASGGYYISCGADAIFANRTTVTGSIGVFGLMVNAQKGLRDKLGITVDIARTNPSADLGMPFRGITERERMFMQYGVDRVYETFVGNVARGRNMRYEQVDEIAEGRIWNAVDAGEVGLVDGFGGLVDAIEYAADRAGVDGDYRVVQMIDTPSGLASLLGVVTEVTSASARSQMGDMFIHYNSLKSILEQSGKVQARMPYTLDLR